MEDCASISYMCLYYRYGSKEHVLCVNNTLYIYTKTSTERQEVNLR